MDADMKKALELLSSGDYTCAACRGDDEYVELGAKAVHALILSRAAQEVFTRYSLPCTCDTLVDAIANRTNTGLCPMESAVWDITDPAEAERAIRAKLKALMGK